LLYRLDDETRAFSAGRQRILGALAFGDVGRNPEHGIYLACVVPQGDLTDI